MLDYMEYRKVFFFFAPSTKLELCSTSGGDWGDISSLVAKQILFLLCFNLWRLDALTYQGINFTPVGCFIRRKYVYQQYGKEKASGEGFAL